MTPEQLKASILQLAIQGKLVEQRPEEGTAEDLYQQIQEEKQRIQKEGGIKKGKKLPPISCYYAQNFPSTWKVCYLDDIAFVTKLAGFEYTKYIANNLTEKGIPLFKGKNIQKGKIDFTFESFIPESVSRSLKRSQIRKKCLLTPYVGTIGNIAIFNGEFKAHLGSNVGKIELYNAPNHVFVFEEFVFYYLKSSLGYQELIKFKKATAQESISIDAIRNVVIPIPPLAEQKRIVAKVEELLPLVEKYKKAYSELEILNSKFSGDMKKSILQYAIQGKLVEQRPKEGSAEDLYQQIQEEKQNLIKEGKLKKEKPLAPIADEEIPFDIPENWKWARVGSIGAWGAGSTPSRTNSSFYGGDIPWLKTGDLTDGDVDTIPEKITQLAIDKCSLKVNPVGSVLIAMYGATIGKLGILTVPATTNQACCACSVFNGMFNKYLFYFLMSRRDSFTKIAVGGAQPNISKEKIVNSLIPLPPLSEQKRIVAKVEELLALCDKLKLK